MTINARNFFIGALALSLLGVLLLATPPPAGIWLRTAYDAAHVPLFGAIAIGALLMTPAHWRTWRRFGVSMLVVIVLGALSELAQIPTARSASLGDLVADLLGGAGALCIAIGARRSFSAARTRRRYLVPIGLVAVAVPLLPLAYVSAAYVERSRVLPSLVRFESRFADLFVSTRNAELTRVSNPASGGTSARLLLGEGRWPGITLSDIWPDWAPYNALELDIENPTDTDLPMTIRIDDRAHRDNQSPDDRFNRRLTLAPGRQVVRIAIDEIRDAPADRTMDMAEIERVILFGREGQAGRVVVVHDLRLAANDAAAASPEAVR